MPKEFDKWNEYKKHIDAEIAGKFYHEREIWWCSLGVNIGSEHNGTGEIFDRPVLILKALSKNTCLVIPLTSSSKKHSMRISIGSVSGKSASAVLSQLRVIDTKRLMNRICFLETDKFDHIKKTVRDLL